MRLSRALWMGMAAAACTAALWACGPTVGDPCTTSSDCGLGACLLRAATPGGYCSRACGNGDATPCPSGSTCVTGVGADGGPGCLLLCTKVQDCRQGYDCRAVDGGSPPVCYGT